MTTLIIPESLQRYANLPRQLDLDAHDFMTLLNAIKSHNQTLFDAVFDKNNDSKPYVRLIYQGKFLDQHTKASFTAGDRVEIITSLVGG